MAGFSVDAIPTSPRKPGVYIGYDLRSARIGLGVSEQIGAYVGQKLSSGSAIAGTVYAITSADDAAALFGAGSWLHRMFIDAFTVNSYARYVAVCGADDGTKASKTVTLAGTALSEGAITVSLAGETSTVSYSTSETASTVVSRIAAELAKTRYSAWPISVTNTAGAMTFTAKNGGIEGNSISVDVTIAGSGFTVSGTGAFVGGIDGSFDVNDVLDALAPGQYAVVAFPYVSATRLAKLKKYLNFVSGPVEQRPATAYVGYLGTTTDVITLVSAINDRRISVCMAKSSSTPIPQIAGSIAAAVLLQPDPALPFDGFELATVGLPLAPNLELTRTEQELLLKSGVTPLESVSSGSMAIVRLISTEIDGVSEKNPDMWIRTLDFVREAVVSNVKIAYKGAKLTTRAPGSVRAFILGILKKLEDPKVEIVKNVELWKDRLIVDVDSENPGWLKVRIPVDAVNGLHGMTGYLELLV